MSIQPPPPLSLSYPPLALSPFSLFPPSFSYRPDITVMVDWALKINYLSIYLSIPLSPLPPLSLYLLPPSLALTPFSLFPLTPISPFPPSLLPSPTPLSPIHMHDKDPVVHVRVQWITDT